DWTEMDVHASLQDPLTAAGPRVRAAAADRRRDRSRGARSVAGRSAWTRYSATGNAADLARMASLPGTRVRRLGHAKQPRADAACGAILSRSRLRRLRLSPGA